MLDKEEERSKLLEEIEDLIERKRYAQLRDLLLPLEAADIAALCQDMKEDTIPLVFRLLPKELAAEVFVELDSDQQELLIRGFSNAELKEVLDELYLDDTVDIVEEMPAGYADKMEPVIRNIPVLIVMLVLTIPVAILAIRIAEKVMGKQAKSLQ